ncbi:tRNA(fMet)-specific endonuclease VapC [uncultured archaeon]|nr:tRNA(fMet)-specific endonuclease VapC [uncultured archaeon]
MTVLDTNFLIDVLRDKRNPEAILDMIEHPKTTTVNIFELYFGAERSVKTANIHAKLKNLGRTLDIEDLLIAGIVMANNEELLTRDDHFSRIPGLRCRSW